MRYDVEALISINALELNECHRTLFELEEGEMRGHIPYFLTTINKE